jgi:POT family proton-dependent oligopeptide transporter
MAYRTTPTETAGMPPGIPYIVGNEGAERFTFYALRGVLVVFMTKYLLDRSGAPAFMNDDQSKAWYHMFVGSAYFFPMLGALVSDGLWGK